jgi:hypothetical protein
LLGPLKKVGLSLIVKVGGKFAKHLFDKWVSSGFTNCSPPIPKFLCSSKVRPSPHRIMWGVGIANSIQGRSPGVWTRPTSPRLPVGSLTPGSPYYLTCWTLGDLSGGSSLWYRLPSGGYVADVWLFTGTDNVIPGVQHC